MIFISETFNEVEKRSYSVESKDSPTDLTKFELKVQKKVTFLWSPKVKLHFGIKTRAQGLCFV